VGISHGLYFFCITAAGVCSIISFFRIFLGAASFCVDALEQALARFSTPEIFNTGQGGRFTSEAFTDNESSRGISMDGRGRWVEKVFVERHQGLDRRTSDEVYRTVLPEEAGGCVNQSSVSRINGFHLSEQTGPLQNSV